jgi:hypothetical protein
MRIDIETRASGFHIQNKASIRLPLLTYQLYRDFVSRGKQANPNFCLRELAQDQ